MREPNAARKQFLRLLGWLRRFKERRKSRRRRVKNVLAVYWDGLPDSSHSIRDVSLGGAYIETPVDWGSGTLIQLNLIVAQEHDNGAKPEIFRNLWSLVVRKTSDGFCVEFVFEDPKERKQLRRFLERSICEAEA